MRWALQYRVANFGIFKTGKIEKGRKRSTNVTVAKDLKEMKSELYFSELVPIGLLESVADFGIANSIAIGEREQTISIARELGKPINLSDNWSIYRKIDLSIGQLIYLSKNWSIYQKLMYLSNNLSIYRTIDLSIEQLIYLSNNWSICRTIDLSMEQLIYLLNN